MSIDDLDKLRELLCEFDCTYALDSDEENAIDVAINAVSKVMEGRQ